MHEYRKYMYLNQNVNNVTIIDIVVTLKAISFKHGDKRSIVFQQTQSIIKVKPIALRSKSVELVILFHQIKITNYPKGRGFCMILCSPEKFV